MELLRCVSANDWRAVDAYIAAHPHASFAHRPAWRDSVRRAYRLPRFCVVARRQGGVVGVAPWSVMLSPLAGPYLVLGPFASYADMLVDDCEVAGRLLEETRRRARARGIGYIQLRSRFTHPPAGRLSIRQDATRFATWTAATAGSPDAVWDALESRARGAVRRARKHGVTVEQCRIGERFLDVFRHGMRSLGSPFHDRRFFRALQTAFGERLLCLLAVTESGQPASASLCIQDGETLHYVYGQNVHEQRHTAANSLIVWRQIELACERGLARVDLGRGEVDSSNKRFKDSWGVISPLCETVVPVWRRKPPDLTPTNPGFQAVQKTWSRLPLAVTRRVGPLLMMGIG